MKKSIPPVSGSAGSQLSRFSAGAPCHLPPGGNAGRKERAVVWVLACVAAIRVFVFSAAFPFFNNVDEKAHFDLVVRFSHADLPRGLVPFSEESATSIALYGTPEYLLGPEKCSAGVMPPPLWTLPAGDVASTLPFFAAQEQRNINPEATQAPLYYTLAGLWLQLGRVGRIEGGFLLYWIRFLNVFLVVGLVWLGFWAARLVSPEHGILRLGMPLLLAFHPQDIFYSVQNDVLSPLCYGLAFIGLVKLLRADLPGVRLGVFTGLALACTALVKATNLPLVAVGVGAVLFKAACLARAGRLRVAMPAVGLLMLLVLLPLGGWFAWNLWTGSGLTGTAAKIQLHTWTRKPLVHWWPHPIFTPGGLWRFWSELMASFWRGEFTWSGKRLASPVMDAFYWASSLLLPAAALIGLRAGSKGVEKRPRQALLLAFWSFTASVAFLALVSVSFDFGNCYYPSRAHPFCVSGRLMSGSLIPFLMLYVHGLDRLLGRSERICPKLLVLAGIALAITASEVKVNLPAFSSAYNWFHLWNPTRKDAVANFEFNPAPALDTAVLDAVEAPRTSDEVAVKRTASLPRPSLRRSQGPRHSRLPIGATLVAQTESLLYRRLITGCVFATTCADFVTGPMEAPRPKAL